MLWDDNEPSELIAIWDSADEATTPACFLKSDWPRETIPSGQFPMEGQFWLDGLVKNARIWLPTPDGMSRRPVKIYVFHLELEFHGRKDSPVTLLPDLEFYDEPGFRSEGTQGVRRIDLGRRIVERLRSSAFDLAYSESRNDED